MINNTIAQNIAVFGGAINCSHGSMNSIITICFNNVADSAGSEIHFREEYNANFVHCLVSGGREAFGQDGNLGCPNCSGMYLNNIDVNPAFVDMANGDFQLSDSSPCIGAGIAQIEVDDITYYAPQMDYYDQPCPLPPGSQPDIGAIENELSLVGITSGQIPSRSRLMPNYPNPCDQFTIIPYFLEHLGPVTIELFDMYGKLVWAHVLPHQVTGKRQFIWKTAALPAGMYICSLKTEQTEDWKTISVNK